MLQDVNEENFDRTVSEDSGAVLIDFWGPRCQPCLALLPEVERLAQQFAGRVAVVKVNATSNPRLCLRLKVSGLPAFILFVAGREQARLTGKHVTPDAIRSLLAVAEA
jgi:thioredoxin 1